MVVMASPTRALTKAFGVKSGSSVAAMLTNSSRNSPCHSMIACLMSKSGAEHQPDLMVAIADSDARQLCIFRTKSRLKRLKNNMIGQHRPQFICFASNSSSFSKQ
jgi:hypothetical protein